MSSVEDVASTLAASLRVARAQRGWRLDDLAEASGVSRGMIHRIETASTHPSVSTLAKLSGALGIPISELVETPAQLGTPAPLANAAIRRHGRSVAALLVSDGRHELWRHTLHHDDPIEDAGHPAGARELIHVTQGTLRVGVGGATFTVPAGDGLALRGDRPHRYENPEPEPAIYTVVVSYTGASDPRY